MNDVKLNFVCRSPTLIEAWKRAFKEHIPDESKNFTFSDVDLRELPASIKKFDCIVSPANSYGILDGGFDKFLSEIISPKGDIEAATRISQVVLYDRWRGYAPPGSCTLVPLQNTVCSGNEHGCRFIAIVPTMRVPQVVTWNKEIVYNCTWALLNEVCMHNSRLASMGDTADGSHKIKTILLTGFAAGTGLVPAERCAQQTALAFKHFYAALAEPDRRKKAGRGGEKAGRMGWEEAMEDSDEVAKTHHLDDKSSKKGFGGLFGGK